MGNYPTLCPAAEQMPKQPPFSTRANPVSSRQPQKQPSRDYPPRASVCGAKRLVSQDRQLSRGAKRPRILPDLAAEDGSPGSKRRSHDLQSCSTGRTAPASGVKRSVSQGRQPSHAAKRPRMLPDPAAEDGSTGGKRRSRDLLRSCSTGQTAHSCGAKRSVSQDQQPSRGAKRRRILPYPAADDRSLIQIRSPRRKHDLPYCSFQIPISWAAKRVRSERASQLLPVSQIPTCGANQAGSDPLLLSITPSHFNWYVQSDEFRFNFSSSPPFKSHVIISGFRRDWTNLGDGPAGLIAERLLENDVADYIRFRAVCRPWRRCSMDPRDCGILERRFHPRKWIMHRKKGGTPYRRVLTSVSAGCCIYVDLPELRGHDVFGPTTEGLLVLLDRTTYVIRLLNPLTRQAANLPLATMLLINSGFEGPDFTDCLDVSGAGLAGDSTIAVYFSTLRTVAVARPGDVRWTVVDCGRWLAPAMSFAGRFYCATTNAVMVVDIGTDQDHPPRLSMVAKLTRPLSRMMMDTVHLVDNDGELMLVDRQRNGRKYRVYRVDLEAKRIVPVRDLGGRAVFMGIQRAICVSRLVFPSVSADAIYLGFDDLLASGLGLIHLMDGTIETRDINDDVPCYGPRGVDNYLSWCVTDYCDNTDEVLDV